jgi:glycosyltransferase involved in cell wall biosynthesis
MRIAYITAGAAGMFCGSCMHDNTLVATLCALGHEALLIPTYTPIRTDEQDVSQKRVFFGGINVYLQQKLSLFRHTPWFLDRPLDSLPLLRWVSRFAMKTRAEDLGSLAVSVLEGEHGHQAKEVAKLARWLAHDVKPEIVNLTNVLLSGSVHDIKERLNVPVLCTLQGDDIFLEALPPDYRAKCMALVRAHCEHVDGFISTSAYYADFMAEYLKIPRGKIDVVHPGLNLKGHGDGTPAGDRSPCTNGYFARISPEKGLHVLADARVLLAKSDGVPAWKLRISGWLGANDQAYFEGVKKKLADAGLEGRFEHVDSPDHACKVRFLQSLDILSVPTTYREPKGLYVLEALANGVPVVQPRHGSFPELVEATGGGLLVQPEHPQELAAALRRLMGDAGLRKELGTKGREVVHRHFHADRMARETVGVYQKYVK